MNELINDVSVKKLYEIIARQNRILDKIEKIMKSKKPYISKCIAIHELLFKEM